MNARYPGYQGIWFALGQVSEYGDKYSGGLGTYTAKHVPVAIHAREAGKTFFSYGGSLNGKRHLLNMVGCFDHATCLVEKPAIVHDKGGVDDPHDNGSLMLDGDGHLWVFVSGRGRKRPGYVYRSAAPYSIASFDLLSEREITYPQPWWIPDEGCLHLFTKYTGVRELYWTRTQNGRDWADDQKLAGMGGHYQTSRRVGNRVGTAFNAHVEGHADRRVNLYYVETEDLGETWRTAGKIMVEPPLTSFDCEAQVLDTQSKNRLCYMKDLVFDDEGRPVILAVVSAHHEPGPGGDPRIWTILHWQGDGWATREVAQSTHNYDMGSLAIHGSKWCLIAPTEPGPQHHGTGGEVALWISDDAGAHWRNERNVTAASCYNHAYVRVPLNAHPDFAAFWADGDPDVESPSRLYFTDRDGSSVWRLPSTMEQDFAEPEVVNKP